MITPGDSEDGADLGTAGENVNISPSSKIPWLFSINHIQNNSNLGLESIFEHIWPKPLIKNKVFLELIQKIWKMGIKRKKKTTTHYPLKLPIVIYTLVFSFLYPEYLFL